MNIENGHWDCEECDGVGKTDKTIEDYMDDMDDAAEDRADERRLNR